MLLNYKSNNDPMGTILTFDYNCYICYIFYLICKIAKITYYKLVDFVFEYKYSMMLSILSCVL